MTCQLDPMPTHVELMLETDVVEQTRSERAEQATSAGTA